MIYVADLDRAATYYRDDFGLREAWRDVGQVRLALPDTDAEVVLHTDHGDPSLGRGPLPGRRRRCLRRAGRAARCCVVVRSFDVAIGRCAVIEDPFGTPLCVLDMSSGPRVA
jgi:catechol 2,3-dioxygenase-like lactoylglutathione lyase family enzyme